MTRMDQTPVTILNSASNTTASFTVSTGTYLAGTVLGSVNGTTNGPGAFPIRASMENGGAFMLTSVRLTGLTTTYPVNLWLFQSETAAANTNGATFTLSAADNAKFLGVVGVSGSDYFAPGAGVRMAYVGTGMTCFTASTTTAVTGYLVTTIVTTGATVTPVVSIDTVHVS